MGDCIDRQAVLDGIEELKKSPWATDKRSNGFEYLIKEALEVVADLCVKKLPPVTPQPKMCFDGMTNGEVVQELFPNPHISIRSYTVWVGYDSMSFTREWWDAPYKAESEDNE